MAVRGPLPLVIYASTGEDVRRCIACWSCEALVHPGMDLTIGELMRATARDDEGALDSTTLWACAPVLHRVRCQQGIDVPAVVEALRAEALIRGRQGPATAGSTA